MKSKLLWRIASLLLSVALVFSLSSASLTAQASEDQSIISLSDRTTDSLIDEILEGHHSVDVYALSSSQKAYEYWVRNYEVFAELETRSDASNLLDERYKNYANIYNTDSDKCLFRISSFRHDSYAACVSDRKQYEQRTNTPK